MPIEGLTAKTERARVIMEGLRKAYPSAHCELVHENPLQLLIATILSAQCTDKKVNSVTPHLFQKYRSAKDFAQAKTIELEAEIRPLGFFRNKTKSIQACCRVLVEKYGGEIPKTMEELNALPGVGRKTANVVLGNAFGVQEGIVVDTHVARLSQRLALTRHSNPEKIEADLQKIVPQKYWTLFSHWLIWHGRRRCYARNPDCAHCEILGLCPTGQKRLKAIAPKPKLRRNAI